METAPEWRVILETDDFGRQLIARLAAATDVKEQLALGLCMWRLIQILTEDK